MLIADSAPTDVEGAISVVSITAELHWGTLLASETTSELGAPIGSQLWKRHSIRYRSSSKLPDLERLAAAVAQRGGKPRRRQLDLAIAATAAVARVPLLTFDLADFQLVDDLVDARLPHEKFRLLLDCHNLVPVAREPSLRDYLGRQPHRPGALAGALNLAGRRSRLF